MTDSKDKSPSLPKLSWKKASCTVCGASFDYMSRRRPSTCNNGECLYKYHYGIDKQTWAEYQPTLFDEQ